MTEHATPEPAEPTGRIVLLTTSHRVAPGLLSWSAWQTLHAADRVLCADPDHPQLPYLREAGVEVLHAVPDAHELVEACAGGATVVVLPSGEGDQRLTDGLARLAAPVGSRCRTWNCCPAPTTCPARGCSTWCR